MPTDDELLQITLAEYLRRPEKMIRYEPAHGPRARRVDAGAAACGRSPT